jgi:phosphoribosyl-ATP pyrophosphohydrolase
MIQSNDSDKLSPNSALFGRTSSASPKQTIYDSLQQPFARSKTTKMFDAEDSKLSSFTQQLINYHEQRILQKIEEGSISIGEDAASKRANGIYPNSNSNLDTIDVVRF